MTAIAPNLPTSVSPLALHSVDDIAKALPSLLPDWPVASPQVTQVHPILGGITNRVFKAWHPARPNYAVLVRIFGSPEVFSPAERATENMVFEQLSAAGLAPSLLALFANGRIEAFLCGRTAALDEMRDERLVSDVARAMARLHRFVPQGATAERKPALWADLERWAGEARQLHDAGRLHHVNVNIERCERGLRALRAWLHDSRSPVVFCHNDALCGNIFMLTKSDKDANVDDDAGGVALLDFEYAGMNFRGFDIGNFFCEAMGGTEDGVVHEDKYPSAAVRARFCQAYLEEGKDGATKGAVEGLMEESERFGVAAHLYWGLWAVVQCAGSGEGFPYAKFAQQRLQLFFKLFPREALETSGA